MASAPINQLGLGFPSNKVVRMRYAQASLVGVSTANAAEAVFRANGVFDPDFTGGGHQPLGFDQWSQFYKENVVLSCTMTATLSHLLGLPGRTIIFGIYLDEGSAPQTDWRPLVESGRAAWTLINPGDSIGSQHNLKTLKAYFSAKKFFNVADVKDNVTRLGATFSSNPTQQAFFHCFFATVDQGTPNEATQFDLTVTLDYAVALSEPANLTLS